MRTNQKNGLRLLLIGLLAFGIAAGAVHAVVPTSSAGTYHFGTDCDNPTEEEGDVIPDHCHVTVLSHESDVE